MNDVLKLISEDYKMFLYADDMLIMHQNVNKTFMLNGLQNKLNSTMEWCARNKSTVNRD